MLHKHSKWISSLFLSVFLVLSSLTGCTNLQTADTTTPQQTYTQTTADKIDFSTIPNYTGEPVFVYNNNQPLFTTDEITTDAYEQYSDLDSLGRVQTATACLGTETLPTEDREDISSVTPTGWKNKEYDTIDGGYIYNRCHMIGFQLSGENDNPENLFTGTRYLNIEGMLSYENQTKDYITETDNHVMYRVTPNFQGNELVCRGVLMEAYSVEDNGTGLSFCIYAYNVQPGITIDYTTGDNYLTQTTNTSDTNDTTNTTYILNTNSKTIHIPDCTAISKMSDKNKQEYTGSYDELIQKGYHPCGICNPH